MSQESSATSPLPKDPLNPKDVIGSSKLPLHLCPATATAMGCLGLLEGMCKYGRSNWRAAGVRASIYVDAAKRHLDAWFEGEELSPEGVPHLANALACLAILVDAEAQGKLHDDRQYAPGKGYWPLIERLTPMVEEIKRKYADKVPKHWDAQDMRPEPTPACGVEGERLELRTSDNHSIIISGAEKVTKRLLEFRHGVVSWDLGKRITHYSHNSGPWIAL